METVNIYNTYIIHSALPEKLIAREEVAIVVHKQ